jgi:hypothetical protein
MSLERGPLSLLSTTEESLDRKSIGFGLENPVYGRRGSAALAILHPSIRKTLALTLLTNGGRSVTVVRSRTKTTELVKGS